MGVFQAGTLRFEDSQNAAIDSITVNVSGNGACKKALLAWPGGWVWMRRSAWKRMWSSSYAEADLAAMSARFWSWAPANATPPPICWGGNWKARA